jgi:hypothetical protein
MAREQWAGEKETVPAEPLRSSTFRRLASSFLWLFVLLAVGVTYYPWTVIPVVGGFLSSGLDSLLTKATPWMAASLFHLSGIAVTPHPTDSRDTALGWITILLVIFVAILGTALWEILHRGRPNNAAASVWVRYLLRLALGFIMLRYGIFKIFPLQMSHPSLAVLNEPLGQSSPMTLLWTLIGLSPAYQIASGVLEAACGLLLFFRRTALIGALLGIVVVTNVVLLNFCFDVPVKLGALLILFALFVLAWPDLRTMYGFFVRQTSSRLESPWRPAWKNRRALIIATSLEIAYLFLSLYFLLPASYQQAMQESANRHSPSPLAGEWRVDSATMIESGQTVDAPVLTAEGVPMTALFLEPDGRVMARSADGRLWRAGATINTSRHSLDLYSGYFDGTRFNVNYTYSQFDNDHLKLTPLGDHKQAGSTLLLTRVPLPSTYPLLQAHFKWVQEWAVER